MAWISADESHDTHASFILSSSTLNLRHFCIVMGSKCKGIMGTVVLCTSCPLLSECVISHSLFSTLKKHAYSFVSSYPYYTLVHDHIWISYFIFYFPLLECRFITRQHRNTLLSSYSSSVFTSVQMKHVPIVTRYIPLFLSSFEIVFNHTAHFKNAFRRVDFVFDHT